MRLGKNAWNEGPTDYTMILALYSVSRERDSRLRVAGAGGGAERAAASGATRENATSGVLLSLVASGKSFCSGKNRWKHSDFPFAQD